MGVLTRSKPLWDLRRGDADDDRASPHGRGWRALAVSTALELNYLSAAIAFAWLILVPAFLVGLAVPIATTLGDWKVDALGRITIQPRAALISLFLLLGVALWIARPLLAMALDNVRHLHDTLVFPLFVALREVASAGLERLPPARLDAEQLHRRRVAGTVLAGVALAGAGLMLATGVGVFTGAGLHDLRSLRPGALVRAAIGNAAVVLGASTIAASLYWLYREATAAAPVVTLAPARSATDHPTLRIAHLSDLHLVGERFGTRMESGMRGPSGNSRAARALSTLEAMHAARPLDRIVITGDITDAGTRAEWVEFLALVEGNPGLRERLLVVPGNHDVNIVDRTNPGRLDLPWSAGGALRKLRAILTLDAVQGDRVRIVDRRTGSLGPTLAEYLRTGERPALLRDLADRGAWHARWEAARVWDEIFPMVVAPSDDACGVVLLDSNARRHFSLTNAIGVVGRAQLRALDAVLGAHRRAAWIVVVHHHLVEYPIRCLGLDERLGVVLVNAPDVLRVLARHDGPVLVLHGHRHRDWTGTRGRVVVCSAPSVTLGDKGAEGASACFSLYDVAFAHGRPRLMAVERVAVPHQTGPYHERGH